MSAARDIPGRVDALVIGGGISGAGVALEAARTGASVLLAEAGDFAAGTSSRSSKLVHGGLRYLKTGQWRLTRESVRERQRLLREAPGLVRPLRFAMPIHAGAGPGRRTMQLGLRLYDAMAGAQGAQRSRWHDPLQAALLARGLREPGLLGAVSYLDAQTDDARLVWRVLEQACRDGAVVRNYLRVERLLRSNGRVCGAVLRDLVADSEREVQAGVVIATAGVWSPSLQAGGPRLRPLRGSHFLFPWHRLPLGGAVSWLHPSDRRPVFAYPWEGATLYGTTDVDHAGGDPGQARMDPAEADYLLEGLRWMFPHADLDAGDALSSYAGVRPVVASGRADPSAEPRESVVWTEPGLVAMTGGKLTTFRASARQMLRHAARFVPALAPAPRRPVFDDSGESGAIDDARLHARLGARAAAYRESFAPEPLLAWHCEFGELLWAARHEQVVHLDDLLLRRTRLGLLMPDGAAALLDRILDACGPHLGWDASRRAAERGRYLALWRAQHAPHPEPGR